MASNEVDFRALYQSSLKLTTGIDEVGIPRIEKGLEQLDDASRELYHRQQLPTPGRQGKKRVAASAGGGVHRANFLLASKGIDAEKLSRELQAFEIAPEYEAETPLGATDLEGYLTHHHEMIVLTAIEDVNRRTAEATHDRMNRAMIDDFESAKQRLVEDLGGSTQLGIRNYSRALQQQDDSTSVFATADRAKSESIAAGSGIGLTGVPFSGQPRFADAGYGVSAPRRMAQMHGIDNNAMSEEMRKCYGVVRELNNSRVPNTRSQFDVVGSFRSVCANNVSSSVVGSKWEAVLKCWELLSDMLAGGDASRRSVTLAEREFSDARDGEADKSKAMLLKHRFAFGARVFLENQFRTFVQQIVQKHQLATGGVPDLVANVRAFVRYLQSSRYAANGSGADVANTDANAWALLYYTLRCGGDAEAVELAGSVSQAGDASIDADILCALRYRAQQKKSMADPAGASSVNAFSKQFPAEYEKLVGRYHRLTSASIDSVAVVDPYERCVLNLLCFGNPNASEPRILTTVEDYLWQRLCFIQRVFANSAPDSAYSIERLAKSIAKFGPAHFEGSGANHLGADGNLSAFLYFEILLMTQEFEKAVKYIGSKGFLLEAVHFAIALNHYGLLRCTSSYSMMDEEDETTVDFVRLIRQYIHAFQRANASEAADYVACISELTAKKELLAELLLETRKYDALAGSTNNTDGSRTRGLYDRLLKNEPEEEVKELILSAARKAEMRGLPHDAFALLKAAGDVEGVIALLNAQLSATLGAAQPEREEWFRQAKEFAHNWMRFPWVQVIANKYARTAAIAFQTLLNMNIFLEIFEKQQYEDAIRFVDELEVVPTQSASNLATCVDRFLAFDESVRQNFHVLLLGYMECLVRDADRVKTQLAGDVRRVAVATLREKAELLVTFAGMIKFRLPAGTNERLNRMEAMIY